MQGVACYHLSQREVRWFCPLKKALNRIPPPLCDRQVMGPSSLTLLVVQPGCRLVDWQTEHELTRTNK